MLDYIIYFVGEVTIIIFIIIVFLSLHKKIESYKIRHRQQHINPKFKIIGVTGFKHNGKDTIAKYMCDKYGYTRIAFADPLKLICGILFGFNYQQLHGELKETPDNFWFGLTPRKVFQFIGTDLFRKHMNQLDENFQDKIWLLCANKSICDILQQDSNACIVISDVRFPNECEMIKKFGGIIIRVNRSSANMSVDLHDSEALIKTLDVDFDITNNDSIDDLNKKIDILLL